MQVVASSVNKKQLHRNLQKSRFSTYTKPIPSQNTLDENI